MRPPPAAITPTSVEVLDLSNNENPLGPSARVAEALAACLGALHRYPDDRGQALRAALAARAGLEPDRVVLGNGSNELIDLVARVALQGGGRGVTLWPAFGTYPRAIRRYGAEPVRVACNESGVDLQRLLRSIDRETRLLFIASPNNPTGALFPQPALNAVLDRLPSEAVLVFDEAYAEYVAPRVPTALLERHPNLLLLRSFSKAYGLAALRIGYGLGSAQLISRIDDERPTYNTNRLAQIAALAALDDQGHLARVVDENRRAMSLLMQRLHALGLRCGPAPANFVMVEVGEAEPVARLLTERGIGVKPLGRFGLPAHIRVSSGAASDMTRVAEEIAAATRRVIEALPIQGS